MTDCLRIPGDAPESNPVPPMSCGLVIDDHPMIQLGCRQIMLDAGYDEVLAAASAEEGIETARARQPGVAVLDLGLPGAGGLESIAPLRDAAPQMRILVFTMNDCPAVASRALEAGAHGFLSKTAAPVTFREALGTLRAGDIYLDHQTAMQLVTRRNIAARTPLSGLTPRERAVLFKLGAGLGLSRIADDLDVSYKTAANTSSVLKKKLGASGLNDLIRIAIENAEDRPL